MDKYLGKRLDSRYAIKEIIGIGGMAVVYKAYDTVEDRIVALKILKDEYLGNADFIRRFKNESKAIAVLSHPNIVQVYDVSFGDCIQYIVMEYIDGISLKDYLEQQHSIPWKEAIYFVVQILRALQHAHQKGIIHRDIKPQNIMLLQNGTIKVTDFGIARFAKSETRTITDKAIGSVHYIAPEQAKGEITDERTDIYSVGVMLYEMLTGKLPFVADNAVSVAIMQMQTEPVSPSQINSNIPEGLEEITLKAMRKRPAERYRTAADMLLNIEEFKKNPSIRFQYQYLTADEPEQGSYVNAINNHRKNWQGSGPSDLRVYEDKYQYNSYPAANTGHGEHNRTKRSPSKMILSGILIAFVLTAAGFGIATLVQNMPIKEKVIEEITMPNLVGTKWDDIKNSYEFEYTISYDEKSDQEAGTIIRQNPNAGILVKKNGGVILGVSGKSEKIVIPHNLVGLTQKEAISKLDEVKIRYKIIEIEDAQIAKGYVKEISQKEGTEVDKETVVQVYVSKGQKKVEIPIPNVIGKNLDAAKSDLIAQGFEVGEIAYKDDSIQEKNIILETSPLPSVKAEKGAVVDIVASSGKKSQKEINIFVDLPKNVNADLELKSYLDGEVYKSVIVNPRLKDIYSLNFTGITSIKKLTVFLNGSLYREYTLDFDQGKPIETIKHEYIYELEPQ